MPGKRLQIIITDQHSPLLPHKNLDYRAVNRGSPPAKKSLTRGGQTITPACEK
jgi:hypothetical protein